MKYKTGVDKRDVHKLYDSTADIETQRYQFLIALQLSFITRYTKLFTAMKQLRKLGLTIENMYKMDIKVIESCFQYFEHREKIAQWVKELTKII